MTINDPEIIQLLRKEMTINDSEIMIHIRFYIKISD